MTRQANRLWGLTWLLAGTALSAPAFAEAQTSSAPAALEEIVVTAQRRSEAAQSTPLAITAIGGDQLAKAGVLETADLSSAVPNMQVISPYGRSQPNISVRGVSVANEYNPNQASPIGVYVDDAYLPSRTSHGQQLYDLERVEVLRGPQGTLYGRNTTGGAVNFITRRPVFDGTSGWLEAGYGNFDRRESSGALNAVVVPDKLAVRGAFNWVKSDGMVKSAIGGRAIQSEDSLDGRISVLARPTEDLSIFLKVYAGTDRPLGNANLAIGTGPGGANGLTGFNSTGFGKYEQGASEMGHFRFHASGGLASVAYTHGDWTLTSNTSYDWGGRNLTHDTDDSPLSVLQIHWADDFKDANQELRLNYSAERIKVVVGGYYGWDEVKVDNRFEFLHFLDGIVPFALPLPAPTSGFGIRSRYTQVRRSKALFAQGDLDVTDKLTLTAGLRYTSDSLIYKDGNANILDYQNNPVLNTVPVLGAPYDPNVFLRRQKDFAATSGKIGLNYKVSDRILVFGSYSRGYRAGAVNAAGYLSPTQVDFVPPEEVNAYELGLKSELLDRRLRANLSGFYYDYKNQQLQEVDGPISFLRNAPKSTIYGAEVEITALVTPDLKLTSNLGLLKTEYKKLTLSGIDLSGNRLPFSPEVTASLGVDWTPIRLANGDSVSTNLNVAYNGQQWFAPFNGGPSFVGDPSNNQNQQQSAYTIVNARISYEGRRLYGSIWAKNLFDKFYTVYGLDLRSTFGYDYLAMGSPRTYGATVGVRF